MEAKRIKCPSCGAILDVKNSKSEAVKTIACPQCGATLKVKFKHYDSEDDRASHASNAAMTQKTANIIVDGRDYRVSVGVKLFGDNVSSTPYMPQIQATEQHISRLHGKIVVTIKW